MFEDLKDIVSKASSKSDVAVVLIAGTTGFLIDAGLNAIGFLEPGAVGITFASGALGLKRGLEAMTEKRRTRKAERLQQIKQAAALEEKVKHLKRLLDRPSDKTIWDALDRDLALYKLNLLSAQDFDASLNRIVIELRSRAANNP